MSLHSDIVLVPANKENSFIITLSAKFARRELLIKYMQERSKYRKSYTADATALYEFLITISVVK